MSWIIVFWLKVLIARGRPTECRRSVENKANPQSEQKCFLFVSLSHPAVSQNEVVIDTFGRCVLPLLQAGAGQGGGLSISILKHARHRLDWLASSYEVNISKINGLHAPYGQRPQKTQHEVCVTVGVCVGERQRHRERESTLMCVQSWLLSGAKNYFVQG